MLDKTTSLLEVQTKPFLRWAGGKQKLVKHLLPFLPASNSYERYFEPFVGAGALFFALRPMRAVIGDSNSELMNCYRQVAKCPEIVFSILSRFASRDSSEFYYKVRSVNTEQMGAAERAARFIYLNKAAFNGIYRVNKRGQFNVPYGPSKRGPAIPAKKLLIEAGSVLASAKLKLNDFETTVRMAKAGDFVYLDPPYPPRSRTAFFNHYCKDGFGWDEQLRLARVFKALSERGCLVMLSNAGQRKVDALYREYRTRRLSVVRWVGSNGDRFRVRELVVTNY